MKRVVIEEMDAINAKQCMTDYYYIAICTNKSKASGGGQLGIFNKIDDGYVFNNTSRPCNTEPGIFYKTIESAARDLSNWQLYQFPDFRSAMEYYLEQTK